MVQCPACTTHRSHTETFDNIYSTVFNALSKRRASGIDDIEELAMALSVLVADTLKIDIYR
ncbi:MAG TPA: hypothetical protein DCP92_00740 [Nitrospiraceae bacterium]|jgi:hypothetical protein|nr:hypothetical protein [Nitrospiraceae bacterium]